MTAFLSLSQGVGADMKDPFEAYRKSKSYSFLGSRIGMFKCYHYHCYYHYRYQYHCRRLIV